MCRTSFLALAILLAFSGAAHGSNQCFVPDLHNDGRVELRSEDRCFIEHGDLLGKVATACGLESTRVLIRLRPGLRRCFQAEFRDSLPAKWHEYRLTATRGLAERRGSAVSYSNAERPVYLAIGTFDTREVGGSGDVLWGSKVVTCALDSLGAVIKLDEFVVSTELWTALYILDLDGNGLLDFVVNWAPGVSGGGGINLASVASSGKIYLFKTIDSEGKRVEFSSIDAAYHRAGLCDLNDDGRWEIETLQFISYEGGSGSFEYIQAFDFDPVQRVWRGCTDRYPAQYRSQYDFYRAWLKARRRAEADPNDGKGLDTYAHNGCTFSYEGRDYRLGNVSFEAADVERLLRSFDNFLLDPES